MNEKLFINYRREDTAPYAGRLYDLLTAHFGEDQIFMDIDQIEPGEDFVEVINRRVGTCDIAIVTIGPNWLHATDASGKLRLDDEQDFVRMEIVAALQREIRVIPVLVGGARMPRRQDLPEALVPLSRRNAIELSETRFHADVNRLIAAIEKSFRVLEKKTGLSTTPVAPAAEPAFIRPPDGKDLREPSASQTMPAIPPPASIYGPAALKEPGVWTRKRPIIIGAVGIIVVLLLLALAGSFIRRGGVGTRLSTPAEPAEPKVSPLKPPQMGLTLVASIWKVEFDQKSTMLATKEFSSGRGPGVPARSLREFAEWVSNQLELTARQGAPVRIGVEKFAGPDRLTERVCNELKANPLIQIVDPVMLETVRKQRSLEIDYIISGKAKPKTH